MKYDLSMLSKPQAILDDRICLKHNVCQNDTIKSRILAFIVELGELANETRCFKYWSVKPASDRKIIIEEYVDGIHFLVSLCNTLNVIPTFEIEVNTINHTNMFLLIYQDATNLNNNINTHNIITLFKNYLSLGYNLGFNEDDIINAYNLKNQMNHQRQENNY